MSASNGAGAVTISIANIPLQTTDAEFNRWFLFASGFEVATIITTTSKGHVGLARFSTLSTAETAVSALNGRQLFEEDSPQEIVLSVEFATSQSIPPSHKRPFSDLDLQPGLRQVAVYASTLSDGSGSDTLVIEKISSAASEAEVHAAAGSLQGFVDMKYITDAGEKPMAFLRFESVEACAEATRTLRCSALPSAPTEVLECKFAPMGNPPSNAMLVANLAPQVSEQELAAVVAPMPGFVTLNYTIDSTDGPLAFAQFRSVACCLQAIQGLNGSALPSAPKQALICEFAGPEHALATPGINPEVSGSTLLIRYLRHGHTEPDLYNFIANICDGLEGVSLEASSAGEGLMCWLKFVSPAQGQAAFSLMSSHFFRLPGDDAPVQVEFAERHAEQHSPSTAVQQLAAALRGALGTSNGTSGQTSGIEQLITAAAAAAAKGMGLPVDALPGGGSVSRIAGIHQPSTAVVPYGISRSQSNSCSTLFTSNLQKHCTAEELNQYFVSNFEGFVRLKFTPATNGKGGMCWIKFASVEHAAAAVRLIKTSDYRLPSDPGNPLRIDYAKNDLDCRGGSAAVVPQPPVATHEQVDASLSNAPCDTMFIGALSPNVSEQELLSHVSMLSGFVRLKYISTGPKPLAFVQFDSVDNCATAIAALRGTAMPSAPNQALDCQFSKNSLDQKRPRLAP